MCLHCKALLFEKVDPTESDLARGFIGKCTDHARECAKTCGLFLVIEECFLIMLHINRAYELFSVSGFDEYAPYLDDNLEHDRGLKLIFAFLL